MSLSSVWRRALIVLRFNFNVWIMFYEESSISEPNFKVPDLNTQRHTVGIRDAMIHFTHDLVYSSIFWVTILFQFDI